MRVEAIKANGNARIILVLVQSASHVLFAVKAMLENILSDL